MSAVCQRALSFISATEVETIAMRGTFLGCCARRAQQLAMLVVGFLGSDSPDMYEDRLRAFRQALKPQTVPTNPQVRNSERRYYSTFPSRNRAVTSEP